MRLTNFPLPSRVNQHRTRPCDGKEEGDVFGIAGAFGLDRARLHPAVEAMTGRLAVSTSTPHVIAVADDPAVLFGASTPRSTADSIACVERASDGASATAAVFCGALMNRDELQRD